MLDNGIVLSFEHVPSAIELTAIKRSTTVTIDAGTVPVNECNVLVGNVTITINTAKECIKERLLLAM